MGRPAPTLTALPSLTVKTAKRCGSTDDDAALVQVPVRWPTPGISGSGAGSTGIRRTARPSRPSRRAHSAGTSTKVCASPSTAASTVCIRAWMGAIAASGSATVVSTEDSSPCSAFSTAEIWRAPSDFVGRASSGRRSIGRRSRSRSRITGASASSPDSRFSVTVRAALIAAAASAPAVGPVSLG